MTDSSHPIDYVEINVDDVPVAQQFYGDALGWSFVDYGPTYAAFRVADGGPEAGGLNGEGEPGVGGPLVLVHSPDLDATFAAVAAAGGEVVDAPYDYPGGRRFTFRDPSGNVLGVYQPAG